MVDVDWLTGLPLASMSGSDYAVAAVAAVWSPAPESNHHQPLDAVHYLKALVWGTHHKGRHPKQNTAQKVWILFCAFMALTFRMLKLYWMMQMKEWHSVVIFTASQDYTKETVPTEAVHSFHKSSLYHTMFRTHFLWLTGQVTAMSDHRCYKITCD